MPSFEAKKMRGKGLILLTGMMMATVSCGLEQIGIDGSGDDIWVRPGLFPVPGSGGGPETAQKTWYAVGVDYPDGYDWNSDVEMGSVRCSLVVFANGIPVMKVPVGDEYEVSADPDMYRMIGSSLYTDYSTGEETVIKRNGEQLFRYPGREMILDMVVKDDDVYTLGQDRGGNGFTYRKNGEILLSRESGHLFSGLQQCGEDFAFTFSEQFGADNASVERYYCYCAGNVSQIAVREDVRKVWDARMYNDRVCYIASLTGVSAPVLVEGPVMNVIDVPDAYRMISCRFAGGQTRPGVELILIKKGRLLYSALWSSSEEKETFPEGYTIASICAGGDDFCCVLNPPESSGKGIIYRFGEKLEMPDGYVSMGGKSMAVMDGILYVGLTSKDGADAAVWVDGEIKPLRLSGFISHIYVN